MPGLKTSKLQLSFLESLLPSEEGGSDWADSKHLGLSQPQPQNILN